MNKILKNFLKLNLFRKVFILGFSAVMVSFTLYSLLKIITYDSNAVFFKLFLTIGLLITFGTLMYLAIYDIAYFEIPGRVCVLLPIILLIVNIILGFIIGFNSTITIWEDNTTTPLVNIVGGLAGAGILGFIVYLTKGKGMGEGDIWILAALGFFIGYEKLIIGFYLAIFSALVIGLIYSLKIKKLKGVPVPLVPFLVFGALFSFVFSLDYRILFPL